MQWLEGLRRPAEMIRLLLTAYLPMAAQLGPSHAVLRRLLSASLLLRPFTFLTWLSTPPAALPTPSPPQLKVKTEELLEVYRQQDGAGGVRKVPHATAGSAAPAASGSSGGLLARLRGSSGGSHSGGGGSGSGRPK